MKKILITGGSGLIGTILNNRLNANYDVQNLDRNKPKNKEYNIFIGNINKYEDVLESSKDASAIIHLGAAVQMDSDWKLVFNNNIESTKNVYEAAKNNNLKVDIEVPTDDSPSMAVGIENYINK